MDYLSRFGSFSRPRWHVPVVPMLYPQSQPQPRPKREDEDVFIPPHHSEFGLEDPVEDEEGGFEYEEQDHQRRRVEEAVDYDLEVEEHYEEDEEAPRHVPPPQQRNVQQEISRSDVLTQDSTLHKLRPYSYRPSKGDWKHVAISSFPSGRGLYDRDLKRPCTQLRIITWNIDFLSDRHEERLDEALRYIEEDVLRSKEDGEPEPCCILLQEVHAKVLPYLLRNEWIQRWFMVTPIEPRRWPEGQDYGNVTLVARSLDVTECFILHYGPSVMGRTAICVNVKLTFPGTDDKAVVAVVNTHLESLPPGGAVRPKQLDLCSRFLRRTGIHGGVIAGDMNAILPVDATIGKRLELKDSWRKGDIEIGNTWGYQGNDGFPNGRLDKVFYLPGMGYKVDEPKRIGVGLKIRGNSESALWVSDHYGLDTTLRMLKPRSNSS
ncbi:hypothetical protein CPC08DRAFT_706185 [Agrocybe pediades]|nr:hypothetical protein CPC08DRAFT_706185 [Agrocybe pediades]